MGNLAGKVAIVTGASSGIGYATARLFAAEGAAVVLTARRADRLAALAAAIEEDGGRAAYHAGDNRDEAVAAAVAALAVARFGGLDIAFNNAGATGATGPIAVMTLEQWREAIDVNLTSAFLGAKHQLPAMQARGGGSLLFTSSFVGTVSGLPGMAPYGAAKAGVAGLARMLAAEHGGEGIRVNAIVVGGTDTPANAANAPGSGPAVRAMVEGLHALRRIAQPEEIARAALFLASDAGSFVTGSAMAVDGGVSITKM